MPSPSIQPTDSHRDLAGIRLTDEAAVTATSKVPAQVGQNIPADRAVWGGSEPPVWSPSDQDAADLRKLTLGTKLRAELFLLRFYLFAVRAEARKLSANRRQLRLQCRVALLRQRPGRDAPSGRPR